MASVSAFCYTGAQPVDILKIATFNINGIRSRLPALLEWLEREGPDVVCLQELKAPDAAFPINDIHAAGYGAIWHGQASWNGVAILAKGMDPLESRRGLPGDEGDTHSRYLEGAKDDRCAIPNSSASADGNNPRRCRYSVWIVESLAPHMNACAIFENLGRVQSRVRWHRRSFEGATVKVDCVFA